VRSDKRNKVFEIIVVPENPAYSPCRILTVALKPEQDTVVVLTSISLYRETKAEG
jgi:hypothetical protein